MGSGKKQGAVRIKKKKTRWNEGEPPGLLGGGKMFSFQY